MEHSIFQSDASKVADFRLMESFRSHYVIDSSVGEDILKEQHLIEEKEKIVDKTVLVKRSDIPSNTLKLIEEAEKIIKSKMQSG